MMLSRGVIAALLLLMVNEWQIVNGAKYEDCPDLGGPFGRETTDTWDIRCGIITVFENSKCRFYKAPKLGTRKIRLTEINIPDGVTVKIGQISVGPVCKILYLTSADNGMVIDINLRTSGIIKFSATDTTATIKFICA